MPRRANPEMALVEQEIYAVLFQLNRIWLGIRNALDHFDAADVNFIAAGGARFGLNFSGDDYARFLGKTFERFEGFWLLF